MKKIRKYILPVSVLIFICLFAAGCGTTGEQRLGVNELTLKSFEKRAASAAIQNPETVLWQGQPAPYDAEKNTFYLPQDMDTSDFSGVLSSSIGDIYYFKQDDAWNNKQEALRSGHEFTLLVTGKNDGVAKVVFTGLPMLVLKGEDDDTLSNLWWFDPAEESASGFFCRYHDRGSLSKNFDKKSYKINLCGEDGSKVKANLLNIRKDNDWIINAMYTDVTKAREKVSYQIWQRIMDLENDENKVNSSEQQYIEVVKNGRYQGLYALMPQMDAKQLDLEDGDILYKIRNYTTAEEEQFEEAEKSWELRSKEDSKYVSIEYPDEGSGFAPDWQPFRAWQTLIFDTPSDITSSETLKIWMEQHGLIYNADNAIDYYWFNTLIRGGDNIWKNLYLAMYKQPDGKLMVLEDVWDMNYSFADVWDDDSWHHVAFKPTAKNKLLTRKGMLYTLLDSLDHDSMQAQSEKKWAEWRQNGISADWVNSLFEDAQCRLENSGAVIREQERWPDIELSSEASELSDWIQNRFDFLDETLHYQK